MGEDVEVVGELTDEELLRTAAMDAAWERAQEEGLSRAPDLEPGQFTRRDWFEREKKAGRKVSEATVKRDLADMVEAEILGRVWRQDPRVRRGVWAYWYVDDGE